MRAPDDVRREVRLGEVAVRAVKVGESLTGPGFAVDWWEPVTVVVGPVLDLATRPLYRRVGRWKVGVVRRERGVLGQRHWRLLRREVLPRGEDPAAAMDRLVAEVRAGRHGPHHDV